MKRVLIITYYWPPSGGVGVQRWLKFVKYLQKFNWEPIVYTPENPGALEKDFSTLKDIPANITVLKNKTWEPYAFYNKLLGRKKNEKIATGFLTEKNKPRLFEKFAVWLRGNMFIPDARVFFIKPSVTFLTTYLHQNHIDAIVSTGTPHSMHLIAMALKMKFNLPWLADFRDGWRLNDYYDKLMLTSWADKKHRKLEKKVLQNADAIVTVTPNLVKHFNEMGFYNTTLITNGFDPDDYPKPNELRNEKFTICHTGSLNRDRNHLAFWQALKELIDDSLDKENKLLFQQVGHTDVGVKDSIDSCFLNDHIEILPHLPHSEVVKKQTEADLLVLFINNTPDAKLRATYKIFEYLAASKPILCIGPTNGDAAQIIAETKTGFTAAFDDKDSIKNYLSQFLSQFKANERFPFSNKQTQVYNMVSLTKQLSETLNNILEKKS